jgi:hypothetical protein
MDRFAVVGVLMPENDGDRTLNDGVDLAFRTLPSRWGLTISGSFGPLAARRDGT